MSYYTHTHAHTQHPELVLVGYYTNPNVPHDPDGVALMWDLKFHKETPDYIFNCQVSVAIHFSYGEREIKITLCIVTIVVALH